MTSFVHGTEYNILNSGRARYLGQDPIIPSVCAGSGEIGLVSILISTYNRGYIVGKAIESVLAQTYRPIEIIVVDDGSTDGTSDVIDRFGDEVTYLWQTNQGLAAARNAGLAAARGEFIAFQDSDDMWLPWKLSAQVALMRRIPELSLIWTDMTAIDTAGSIIRAKHLTTMYHAYTKVNLVEHLSVHGPASELLSDGAAIFGDVQFHCGDIFSMMFQGNLVHPPTVLLRRKKVHAAGGLDLAYAWSCEDYEFLWRVSQHGPAALIDAPSILYRVEAEDQLTKPDRLLNKARGNVIALERRLKQVMRPICLPRCTIRRQMADAYGWLAMEELFSVGGSRVRSLSYFLNSFKFNLWQRSWFYFCLNILLPGPLFRIFLVVKQGLNDILKRSVVVTGRR